MPVACWYSGLPSRVPWAGGPAVGFTEGSPPFWSFPVSLGV